MKPAENQDEMVDLSNIKTINELDPSQNSITNDNIKEFLSYFDHTYMDHRKP